MRVCGREFSAEGLARIAATVETEPGLSRRALSRRVCEWLEWRAPNGTLQEVSCRKALLTLYRHGHIPLPPAADGCFGPPAAAPTPAPPGAALAVACSLAELGEVRLVPVSSRYSRTSQVWNGLLDQFHYLGKGPLCGAQLRYLVESARYGWVGALAFSAAQWRLRARDRYIGWTEAARRANLPRVVGNSRFLLLPSVQVPNLASHVLGQAVARLAADWTTHYGYAPVLVETFVDPARFAGTSYRAANWVYVGQTAARATAYPNGKVAAGPKAIYVYPLAADWRAVLCAAPAVPLGQLPRPAAPADWTEEEFGAVPWFDARLTRRLCTLAAAFAAKPGALVPEATQGSAAQTKAAYRFFQNPQVDLATVLRPHVEATLTRCRAPPVVLAVQDTTTLNYTAHPPAGVGPISRATKAQAVGLVMHDTLAFTPAGTPLGLLDVQCWARDPAAVGKKHRRKALPLEAKESVKWLRSYRAVAAAQPSCPGTLLVSVGDREADLYELFAEAKQAPGAPHLLVRAERTRQRQVADAAAQAALWAHLEAQPVAGSVTVRVPARPGQPARTARLAVRCAPVVLRPPQGRRLPPVAVWAIYAREGEPPAPVKAPLDWMLLTTVPTPSFAAACERLTWYSRRWGIEVYHRTLKSGCRIEDRRLDDAKSLQACLAIDLVVAWRVFWLTMVGREQPDTPADQLLSPEEWRVLSAWATGRVPATPPTAREVMHWIGRRGGWLRRGPHDHPGTTCLWRGLGHLLDMVRGYLLALRIHGIRAGP